MQARPFILLSQSVLAAVRAALAAAAGAWARDWGVAQDALGVRAERASEAARPKRASAADWRLCASDAAGAVWLMQAAELQAELQALLFPRDLVHAPQTGADAQLAPAAARRALLALHDALAGAALAAAKASGDAASAPDESAWTRGSGAVLVTVTLGRQHCQLLLNHAAAAALAGPARPDLAPLAAVNHRQALATAPVTLQLSIGAAKVSLGSLISLAVGDVVRLDTKVDEPVRMTSSAGVPLFDVYLGKTGDQVAVEAVIHPSSSGAVTK